MTITEDRAGLLAAIAQAGSAGAEAYKQAQSQLASQQQEAVRQSLANGIAGNAPPGAAAEIERIIGQGYQPRQAQLTSNQATMTDYYGRLGASANTYMGQAEALIPAINQQFENQLALQMAGGGGGSGGGGGGGGRRGGSGSSSSDDWWDALKDTYDTKTNLYKALRLQNPDANRTPGILRQRDAAAALGIPEGVIEAQFPLGEYLSGGPAELAAAKSKGLSVRQFRKRAVAGAHSLKGNQMVQRQYLVDQYRGGPPTAAQVRQQQKNAKARKQASKGKKTGYG